MHMVELAKVTQGGQSGNFEGALAYHAMMGPLEIGYMYAATDNSSK